MSSTIRHISILTGQPRVEIGASGRVQAYLGNIILGMDPSYAHDLILAFNHALLLDHQSHMLDDVLEPELPPGA